MMSATQPDNPSNPSEELQAIYNKRKALVNVVKITHAVERLLNGMQAVLLLGQPSGRIPKRALRAYEALSEKTAILPTQQLKVRLEKLDKHVLGMMERILEIAGVDQKLLEQYIVEPHDNVKSEDTEIAHLITDFKRSAQTSVALRILLRERGVSTPALKFTVPDDIISQQIKALAQREANCRKQIEKNIQNIQQATLNILANEESSDQIKSIVSTIQKNLLRDLKHIQAGRSIESMPMVIEVVELRDSSSVEEKMAEPAKENQPINQNATGTRKRGFFSRLFRWVTTPLSVKWKDIQ